MIPAAKFFDPEQYTGVPGEQTWTLILSP